MCGVRNAHNAILVLFHKKTLQEEMVSWGEIVVMTLSIAKKFQFFFFFFLNSKYFDNCDDIDLMFAF